jgi:hypothetical protein
MKNVLWTGLLLLVGTAAGSACTGILGTFDFEGNAGGAGGTGSASASTSSATSSSGTGGCSGGAASCTDPSTCPAPAGECVIAICNSMGCCGTSNVGDNTAVSTQTKGDCKKVVCDGMGQTKSINDDADLPDDSNVCTTDLCDVGTPSNVPVSPTTPGQCMIGAVQGLCGDPSGSAKGTCVECNVGADCTSLVCQSNKCVSAMCGDSVQNGSETDKDCGGMCGPCADTRKCLVAMDCLSKVCDSTTKTCTPATCSDNTQNQTESDVDCGAACATQNKLCGTGKKCVAATDCQSSVCNAGSKTCTAPNCTDSVKNGNETDVDCGGPVAGGCNRCANNLSCQSSSDCQSGYCDAAKHCSVCTQDSQCNSGLFCNGGVCVPKLANGMLCTGATQCSSNNCVDGYCCNSPCSGTCQACSVAGNLGSCTPVPNGMVDPGTCAGTSTCNGSGVCLSGNGAACTSGATCSSTNCVDGFCCNLACTGACVSCAAALKTTGASDGVCGPTRAGGPPKGTGCPGSAQSTCGNDGFCDGNGLCELWSSSTQCVAASCAGFVHTSSANCNGSGTCGTTTSQTCAPYTCQPAGCLTTCSADTDCTAGNYCSTTSTCQAKQSIGTACGANNQCISGTCADGVCCNNLCSGACQLCNQTGSIGTCAYFGPGVQDPLSCSGANACDGSGFCKKANGQVCAVSSDCGSGNCVDGVCCNQACFATCVACNVAGNVGTCTNIPFNGTDSNPVCSGTNKCDGTGSCKKVSGQSCVANGECLSNLCGGSPKTCS